MERNRFSELENFRGSYKERLNEYIHISKLDSNIKILIMHWGGVFLENYIKHLIIESKNIKMVADCSRWIDSDAYNYLSEERNFCKKRYNKGEYEGYICENPGHDIERAINEIDILRELLVDDKEMEDKIKNINFPLGSNESYINLRYKSSKDIENIDELFNEWNSNFRDVFNWIKDSIKI